MPFAHLPGHYSSLVGKVLDGIDEALASWISAQPIWFLATAPLAAYGRVNVSPRGHDWFASFDRRPRIVRLHGRGAVSLPGDPDFEEVTVRHPPHPGTRAVVVVEVERVSSSCGYGVPIMDFVGERDLLRLDAEKRGPEGMAAYRYEKNAASIDGLPGL